MPLESLAGKGRAHPGPGRRARTLGGENPIRVQTIGPLRCRDVEADAVRALHQAGDVVASAQLDRVAAFGGPVDQALLDVMLPEVDEGRAAVAALRQRIEPVESLARAWRSGSAACRAPRPRRRHGSRRRACRARGSPNADRHRKCGRTMVRPRYTYGRPKRGEAAHRRPRTIRATRPSVFSAAMSSEGEADARPEPHVGHHHQRGVGRCQRCAQLQQVRRREGRSVALLEDKQRLRADR